MRNLYPMWIAALALAALASPVALAANYGFGTEVAKADYDYTPVPTAVTPVSVCAIDDNGDGVANAGEPVVLSLKSPVCAVKTTAKDIRLSSYGSFKAGTAIRADDSDVSLTLIGPLNDNLWALDVDLDGKVKPGDGLYLALVAGPMKVSAGYLRLVPYDGKPAGAIVVAGDPDMNLALVDVAGGLHLMAANIVYKAGSAYYINVDGGAIGTTDTVVEEGDVRILEKAPNPWADQGGAAKAGKPDVQVTAIATDPASPAAGAAFRVLIDVANKGDGAGAGLVTTTLNGAPMDTRGTPTLDPAATARLVVTMPGLPAGPATLAANAVAANFTVGPAAAAPGPSAAEFKALSDKVIGMAGDVWVANQHIGAAETKITALEGRVTALEQAGAKAQPLTTQGAASSDAGATNTVPGADTALAGLAVADVALAAGLRRRKA